MTKLTIGMATHNDYEGVWSTIQSILMYHKEVIHEVEIMVIDNNPISADGRDTKDFLKTIGTYIPYGIKQGTSQPRNEIFKQAETEFVLCVDSHIMLEEGSIAKLIDYFERHNKTDDLYHGPLLFNDTLDIRATHMEPIWRRFLWGTWGIDEINKNRFFEIPMHGMGLFACRRESWLGFNERFRGFGGEEGYIHEKYRQAGRKIISLPFLKWVHRFRKTKRPDFRLEYEDRIRNYLIGFTELGLDIEPIKEHFKDDPSLPKVMQELGL
jgi:hypothetical protein